MSCRRPPAIFVFPGRATNTGLGLLYTHRPSGVGANLFLNFGGFGTGAVEGVLKLRHYLTIRR